MRFVICIIIFVIGSPLSRGFRINVIEHGHGLARSLAAKSSAELEGKKAPRQSALTRPASLKPALSNFMGTKMASRVDVTKKMWDYIRTNKLQDPDNKRMIHMDRMLAQLFQRTEPINMLQLQAHLAPLYEASAVVADRSS